MVFNFPASFEKMLNASDKSETKSVRYFSVAIRLMTDLQVVSSYRECDLLPGTRFQWLCHPPGKPQFQRSLKAEAPRDRWTAVRKSCGRRRRPHERRFPAE